MTPDVYLEEINVTNSIGEMINFPCRKRLPTVHDARVPLRIFGAAIYSPVDILITDPLGRSIGSLYQNGILIGEINEIPNTSFYSGRDSEPEYILILDPIEGHYNIEVYGTNTGTYDFVAFHHVNGTTFRTVEGNTTEINQDETQFFTALVDITPPEINITSPIDGSFIGTKNVTIVWNASDNIGIKYYEVLLGNISYANTSKTSITLYNLSEGLHMVELRAFDLANNTASDFVSFTIDTMPVESPLRLKKIAIGKLEGAKTGEKKVDKEIDEIIEHIQKSIADKHELFFTDDWHIVVKHGEKVFHEEHAAVKKMQKEIEKKDTLTTLKSVFEGAIGDLVRADELLALVAIEDARETVVVDPKKAKKVSHEVEKAENELAKAYKELEKGKRDKAIKKFEKVWKHAQDAIKHARHKT